MTSRNYEGTFPRGGQNVYSNHCYRSFFANHRTVIPTKQILYHGTMVRCGWPLVFELKPRQTFKTRNQGYRFLEMTLNGVPVLISCHAKVPSLLNNHELLE